MAGQLRVGKYTIDINSSEFKQFSTGSGVRTYRKYIKFDPDLSGTVNVVVGLTHLDSGNAAGLRISADAQNIDREGFELVLTTWADTAIYGVGCSWVAAYG